MMTFLTILGIICTIIVILEASIFIAATIVLKRSGYSVRGFLKNAYSFGYHYTDDVLEEEESRLTLNFSEDVNDEVSEEQKRRNAELDAEVDELLMRNR